MIAKKGLNIYLYQIVSEEIIEIISRRMNYNKNNKLFKCVWPQCRYNTNDK
jgi:hypothetical protein